jgi:pilus assembly protein CpaB
MSNRKSILTSILAGILASALNFLYISSEKAKLDPGPAIKLLVAKSDIAANSVIAVGMLDSKAMPQKFVPPGYIPEAELQTVIGQNARSQILAGQPILWSHFRADRIDKTWGRIRLNEGDRAFTILANDATGVGGMLSRGSRIDIIGTFQNESGEQVTKTLLQNITVLSTSIEIEENSSDTSDESNIYSILKTGSGSGSRLGSGSRSYSHITLIVTQEEAELLAFASSQGELWFSMRDPNDLGVNHNLKEITWNSLLESEPKMIQKRILKPIREERKEPKAPKAPKAPVIIIGGMKQHRDHGDNGDDNSEW